MRYAILIAIELSALIIEMSMVYYLNLTLLSGNDNILEKYL